MPILVNLDAMLARKKMTISELAKVTDITKSNLEILREQRVRALRMSSLFNLCKALDCTPGDLLEFKDDKDLKR